MEKINYCNRKLRGKIREICDTEKDFAKMLNISSITISSKLNNKSDWSRKEIEKAIAVLSIKREEIPKYFFEILKLYQSHLFRACCTKSK